MNSLSNFLNLPEGNDINSQDKLGDTMLHTAVKNNDLKTARYLRHFDVKFTIKNLEGDTPLHIACKNHNLELMDFLYRYGGLIETRNNEHKIAFDYLSRTELTYMNDLHNRVHGMGNYSAEARAKPETPHCGLPSRAF